MSKKPVIGITCGEVRNSKYPWMYITYAQGHAYSDAIARAGGIPVILPLVEDAAVLRDLYDLCDGILLAGGNDIDPSLYGQVRHDMTGDISIKRDNQEMTLLKNAVEHDKPILGICRGMQLLNVYCGGTLHQHIPDAMPDAQDHEVSMQHENTAEIAHTLELLPGSKLATILDVTHVAANSQHHQAVDVVGDSLDVTAWAEDGVIEGLEMPHKRFVVAVQPHPEGIEAEVETKWQGLFAAFVTAAQTNGSRQK